MKYQTLMYLVIDKSNFYLFMIKHPINWLIILCYLIEPILLSNAFFKLLYYLDDTQHINLNYYILIRENTNLVIWPVFYLVKIILKI